jgi:taurine transport system permease protein
MIVLLIYSVIFVAAFLVVRFITQRVTEIHDFTSLKTITFGDQSTVRPDRRASVISVITLFLLWGAFTGSSWTPIHVPGPFIGDTRFTYALEAPDGSHDQATVHLRVSQANKIADAMEVEPGDGFARDDTITVQAWRSILVPIHKNDEITRIDGARVIRVNGHSIEPGGSVEVDDGRVDMTSEGLLSFTPDSGLQMEPTKLPPPEAVFARIKEISQAGYQNFTLWEHLGWSLYRVVLGFFLGAIVGIPLGYAMGLSDWFRGWFDPIVGFLRPLPPLALIPLVIIWAGIGETGKIILLFLASLWIMTIAARAGVSGVKITKVHAAYSLGASKWQLMRYVIMPNSLPEIFTGARVAMGVCWGTVVAAELVAAEKGAGMMIMVASRFQLTDIVLMGIILIGVIGYGIDIAMRKCEDVLVPWKGKG